MEDKIINIVKKTIELESDISDELLMKSDLMVLGMNSVMAVQMIVLLEAEFDIEFDDEDLLLENVDSINKITKLVAKTIARKDDK